MEGVFSLKRSVILLLAVIVITATAYTAYRRFSSENAPVGSEPPPVAVEPSGSEGSGSDVTLQDFDLRLLELGGATKRLTDYSEGILFLNFWATWCGYCEQEMPDLIVLDKQMRAEGIGRVVAIDVNEKESVVQAYLLKQGFDSLTVLLDLNGEAAKKFAIEGYPTTFVFRDGTLIDSKVGMMRKEEMEAMLQLAKGQQ